MRILIATAGSRGDVAPYTGLGAELSRAGYDVAVAATDPFAPSYATQGWNSAVCPPTRECAAAQANVN